MEIFITPHELTCKYSELEISRHESMLTLKTIKEIMQLPLSLEERMWAVSCAEFIPRYDLFAIDLLKLACEETDLGREAIRRVEFFLNLDLESRSMDIRNGLYLFAKEATGGGKPPLYPLLFYRCTTTTIIFLPP